MLEGFWPFILLFAIIGFPVILFLSLVTLALFMWCWRRVWPYMKVTGKFLGSWRDVIPLFALFVVILAILTVGWYVTRGGILGTLFAFSLWIMVPLFIIFLVVVVTVWVVKFVARVWPGYRRRFWTMTSWVGSSTEKVDLRVPARGRVAPPPRAAKEEAALSVPWLERIRQWAGGHLAILREGLLSVALWSRRSAEAARSGLLSVAAFLKANAFLLAFPLLLVVGIVMLTVSLPFLPLLSLVMLPVLTVSYLGKTTRTAAGEHLGDSGSLTGLASSVLSSLEKRWRSVVDFVLRLLRLK